MHNHDLSTKQRDKLETELDEIATHSSIRERAAADAERATVDLKKTEYMAGHIGEEFEGTISGVTAFGMFVELANGVEGLVHISSLADDYYEFQEQQYSLIGEHTRKVYRLGDKVTIEALQVNIAERNIDFITAGQSAQMREHLRAQLLGRREGPSQQRGSKGGTSSFSAKKAADRKKGKESRGKNAKGDVGKKFDKSKKRK